MAENITDKIEIVNLYGFSIKTNTLYEVLPKYDANAPSGYKKEETTKALSREIHNIEPLAVYTEYLRAWDTGLFLDSPLLRRAVSNETVRQSVMNNVEEYIIKPFESLRGKGALDHKESNSGFWDGSYVKVYKGQVFNTEDPIQLLQLYSLLLRRVLTPKSEVSNPEFRHSQYCIEDKELAMNVENEKALRLTKAYGLYWGLKTSNKTGLIAILNYLNISVTEDTAEGSLDLMFKRFLEDKRDSTINTKEFIDVAERYTTKEGKNVITFYQKLKEMYASGLVELRGKEVYIDGNYIASSFKTAAKVINDDKEARKIFTSKLD